MRNLKETIEQGLTKKGVSARKMLMDLGIHEPTYYRGIKLNSMSMKNYRRICDYLEIDSETQTNTSKNESASINVTDYWKGLIEQFSKEIAELKMENWNLKKELGKFNSVPFSPVYASIA